METHNPKLVNAQRLTECLFDEHSRPTVRTIRKWQKQRLIPYIKVGRLVLFNPGEVSATINGQFRVIGKIGKANK